MNSFVARVIRVVGALPLLRNDIKPQLELARIMIGVACRPCRNLVQGCPFCVKHPSFERLSLRHAVTDGQPFQGPIGVNIDHQIQSLVRAVLVFQMSCG